MQCLEKMHTTKRDDEHADIFFFLKNSPVRMYLAEILPLALAAKFTLAAEFCASVTDSSTTFR